MPSHPHLSQRLLGVTCTILQPFSCLGHHQEKAPGDPMAHAQKAPHPPHSCGLPHFGTCHACSGQDTWTALTAHLDKHIPSATATPRPAAFAQGLFWLCFTSGPLPTPWLCTPVLGQTPEAGSSCFEQPAHTVLLHITASKVPTQNDRFRITLLLQDSQS